MSGGDQGNLLTVGLSHLRPRHTLRLSSPYRRIFYWIVVVGAGNVGVETLTFLSLPASDAMLATTAPRPTTTRQAATRGGASRRRRLRAGGWTTAGGSLDNRLLDDRFFHGRRGDWCSHRCHVEAQQRWPLRAGHRRFAQVELFGQFDEKATRGPAGLGPPRHGRPHLGVAVDFHYSEALARKLIDRNAKPSETDIGVRPVSALSNDLLPGVTTTGPSSLQRDWRQLRLHALEAVAGRLTAADRFAEAASAHARSHGRGKSVTRPRGVRALPSSYAPNLASSRPLGSVRVLAGLEAR